MAKSKGRTLALGAAAALVGGPAPAVATAPPPSAASGSDVAPVSLSAALDGARTLLTTTAKATLAPATDLTDLGVTAGAQPTAPAVRNRGLLVRVRHGALQRITVRRGLDPVAIAARLREHPGLFTSAGADFVATSAGAPQDAASPPSPTLGSPAGTWQTTPVQVPDASAHPAGDAASTEGPDAPATASAAGDAAADPADPASTTTPIPSGAVQVGTLPTTPSTTPLPEGTTPTAVVDGIATPVAVPGAATPLTRIKGWIPDDHIGPVPWTDLQWNFVGKYGVGATEAWETLRRRGSRYAGGRGVRVAVVDSGVAYRNQGVYRASPDLPAARILKGYDFVDEDRFPDDQSGHGTHVASTIAGADDNDAGLTGLAYEADILPVRVLDDRDQGDVVAIARGIRYAARRHAQILNMSIDFPVGITAAEIPEVMSAIAYARRRGVLMIASSGNNGGNRVALPARSSSVLAVGATTVRGCRSVFSNAGRELDIVAPGGGQDHPGERGCHPNRTGPPIAQITIMDPAVASDAPDPSQLGVPLDYVGTSMAAGHVTGVAALVAGSGILGKDPSADLLAAYLVRSTRDLGRKGRDDRYGAGLVDAAEAVARGRRTTAAVRGARRAADAAIARRDPGLPVL